MDTATTIPPSTALTVVQRAALALGASEYEKELIALAVKHKDITAITNEAGRDDCHSAYMELKAERVAIEKKGKDARDDATKFAKAVISEEDRLVKIIGGEEERLKGIRDKWDAAEEAKRLEAAEAEVRRVVGHQDAIARIKGVPAHAVGKSAADIKLLLEATRTTEIGPAFEEFRVEAEDALRSSLAQLCVVLAGQQAIENDAARAEKDRAELEERRRADAEREALAEAERAETKRLADEAIAAERAQQEKAHAESLAAQRAEQEQELATQRARLDADRAEQQRRDEEAAAMRAEEERLLAARRAEIATEEAALAERLRKEADEAAQVDALVRKGAPIFYKALLDLRRILPAGSDEHEIVERALADASLL